MLKIAAAAVLAAIVAGALLLRPSAPAATAEATDASPVQRLTLDWRITFVTPSETIDLDRGDRSYGEADVYRQSDVDTGAPIGEFKWTAVATEPPGTLGSLLQGVFRLFERGDIHVSVVVDDVGGARVAKGVVTGGTGKFRAAAGVYSDAPIGGDIRARLTFSLPQPAADVERETIQNAIRAYMQDNGFVALPSSEVHNQVGDTSTNDFSAATDTLDLESVGPSGLPFLAEPTTTYFYCWDPTGAVTAQDRVATLDCSRNN